MSERVATENDNSRTEYVQRAEDVPLYQLVPVRGPDGEVLDAYRGVQREDDKSVVSIVSSRYGLVQHRYIAQAVHAIGEALDKPEIPAEGMRPNAPFTRESIRLYSHGRRMEVKLVIGQKFQLDSGKETYYPGVRVYNSLDGAWAVRMEAFALRVCCTNQLYAGARSTMEFRELHLSSAEDLLGQLQRATYEVLDHFDDALDMFSSSMNQTLPIRDVASALSAVGLPRRHVDRIAEQLPEYFGSTLWGELSRWDAYQLATDYLTHCVGPRVNPERERMLERAAARALLLEGAGEGGEAVPA